jgi:hypothetical protein
MSGLHIKYRLLKPWTRLIWAWLGLAGFDWADLGLTGLTWAKVSQSVLD